VHEAILSPGEKHDVIAIFQSAPTLVGPYYLSQLAAAVPVTTSGRDFPVAALDSLEKLERGGDRLPGHDAGRDEPRPQPTIGEALHTIGEARTESRTARVVFPGPLRSGFDQIRRVARTELLTYGVVCLSRQAEHDCPVFAQPAVRSALRRARSAVFLPTRALCAHAPTMTLERPLSVEASRGAWMRARRRLIHRVCIY